MKTNFQKSQSSKILSCYITDIMKSRSVPEGTVSKDGKRVKKNNKWVWIKDQSAYNTRDEFEIGQRFDTKNSIGDNVAYIIRDIQNDNIVYDISSMGRSVTKTVSKKDFIDNVASKFLRPKQVKEKLVNEDHFIDNNQKEIFENIFKKQFTSSIPKDLDWGNLPESAKKKIKDYKNRLIYNPDNISEKNVGLFKELYNDALKQLPKQKYQDGIVLELTDSYIYKPITNLKGVNYNYLIEDMVDFADKNPQFNIDERVLKTEPLDVKVFGKPEKKAFLGDYIKIRRWETDSKKRLIEEDARIIGQLKSDKFGIGWKMRNSKGETFNIWKKYWNPNRNFVGFGDKTNNLIIKDK